MTGNPDVLGITTRKCISTLSKEFRPTSRASGRIFLSVSCPETRLLIVVKRRPVRSTTLRLPKHFKVQLLIVYAVGDMFCATWALGLLW